MNLAHLTDAEGLTIEEAIAALPDTWQHHPRVQAELLRRIWTAGTDDDCAAALHVLVESKPDVPFAGWPPEEVDRAMIEAIHRVIDAWRAEWIAAT